eukprot:TRINITY_DN10037_c0_g1_i1.p1 TRINITY_DN10037_c0_g1~~TRINITY_DN10037_c0_g1_i1.p1  ORF type:complete len:653 (+),score=114.53 TRINITY_DN10037_c0_g1_i1:35-1960(+)
MNTTQFSIILLITVVQCFVTCHEVEPTHRCIHDQLPHDVIVVGGSHDREEHTRSHTLRAGSYNNMKIKMEFYYLNPATDSDKSCSTAGTVVKPDGSTSWTCTNDDILTTAKIEIVKSLAEMVKTQFQQMLKVDSLLTTHTISRSSSCGKSSVGINGTNDYTFTEDMVFWVSARPITTDGVLGFAASCAIDATDGNRPIMGYFNINPSAISSGKIPYLKGLFMHEATHALGFSSANFGSRVLTKARANVTGVTGFYGTKILNMARDHYACPSLDIVEIENDGGSGTAGSHFEKRTFINEIMVGSSSQLPQYSKFTLAVLEETGWYQADYSYADPFGFGYHKGCDFVMKTCSKATWGSIFCTTNGALSCTPDRSGPGSCVNEDGKGSDTLADDCPYYLNIANTACTQSHSSSVYGESYGASSRCFTSTLLQDSPIGLTRSSRCYPTYCKSERDLRVKIGDYWNTCPDGMTITVPGYGGKVECPTAVELCAGVTPDSDAANFPTFESIDPSSGTTGTTVTITGSGFTQTGMKVIIGEACENMKVVSSTKITCRIPKVKFFSSIGQTFKGVRQFVIVQNRETGYSDVGEGAFEITVSISDIFAAFGEWIDENTTLFICIVFSLVFFIGNGIFLYCFSFLFLLTFQ